MIKHWKSCWEEIKWGKIFLKFNKKIKFRKSAYKKRAEEISKIIHQKPLVQTKEFLEMVKIAAEEKVYENSSSVFPAVEDFGNVPNEEIKIPDFEEILKKLSK